MSQLTAVWWDVVVWTCSLFFCRGHKTPHIPHPQAAADQNTETYRNGVSFDALSLRKCLQVDIQHVQLQLR